MTGHHEQAPLRFATFLAPNMLPVYRFLADRIGDRLGRPVELVAGRSFDQFEHGEADLGIICGLPYVWLAARRPPPVEPLAAPVLTGDRYAGRPVYFSDVIVRRDSPITYLNAIKVASIFLPQEEIFAHVAVHSDHRNAPLGKPLRFTEDRR